MKFYLTYGTKLIALGVVLVVLVVVAIALYVRKRNHTTAELRARFGPEYDRAVKQHGSERKAEAKLADRETRVDLLQIRSLDLAERERYMAQWTGRAIPLCRLSEGPSDQATN